MVTKTPPKGFGTSKASKHGVFRLNFSALSLRATARHAFETRGYYRPEECENLHSDGQSIVEDIGDNADDSSNCCFVTFAVKISYKEHALDADWLLCSGAETRPILTRIDGKKDGFVTCLLRHTERLPLFLSHRPSLAGSNGVMAHARNFALSSPEATNAEEAAECPGSNHILESHVFKIAIGAAVVQSGRMVYVGHGWRPLRAIDLFGKRISLELFGDSCNRTDNSTSCVSDACVFFDVNVRYVQWVPCTEHCPLLRTIANQRCQKHKEPSADSQSDCPRDEDAVWPANEAAYSVPAAHPDRAVVRCDMGGSSSSDTDSESQASSFNDTLTPTIPPPAATRPPAERAGPPFRSTVYVGSDPKYRVSVLDMNYLSGASHRDEKSAIARKIAELEPPPASKKIANRGVGDGTARRAKKAPDVQPPATPRPVKQQNEPQPAKTDDNPGFFADLLRNVFGGGKPEPAPVEERPDVEVERVELPPEVLRPAVNVTDAPVSATIGLNTNSHTVVLKIGHDKSAAHGASVLQSAEAFFGCLFDSLSGLSRLDSCAASVRRIWVKPNQVGLFLFTVTVPADRSHDLDYVKRIMGPFGQLSLNSISDVAVLLEVSSPAAKQPVDHEQLRRRLTTLQLGCGMTVYEVSIGTDSDMANPFNEVEQAAAPQLRKTHSDTDVHCDTLISKALGGDLGHASCASAREGAAVETWVKTINRILRRDESSELIQITSPRSSLPLHVDQKWAALLKQLLGSVKAGKAEGPSADAIRFIWPVML